MASRIQYLQRYIYNSESVALPTLRLCFMAISEQSRDQASPCYRQHRPVHNMRPQRLLPRQQHPRHRHNRRVPQVFRSSRNNPCPNRMAARLPVFSNESTRCDLGPCPGCRLSTLQVAPQVTCRMPVGPVIPDFVFHTSSSVALVVPISAVFLSQTLSSTRVLPRAPRAAVAQPRSNQMHFTTQPCSSFKYTFLP
jgi:hypothetical protein